MAPIVTTAAQPAHAVENERAELEKIVRLRDRVLQGAHPRFKLPASATTGVKLPSRHSLSESSSNPPKDLRNGTISTQPRTSLNAQQSFDSVRSFATAENRDSDYDDLSLAKLQGSARPDTNSKRERLELELRKQVEQRQNDSKQSADPFLLPIPDFDLSEVLTKALAIANAARASSRPVDEASFYSSLHDESPIEATGDEETSSRENLSQPSEVDLDEGEVEEAEQEGNEGAIAAIDQDLPMGKMTEHSHLISLRKETNGNGNSKEPPAKYAQGSRSSLHYPRDPFETSSKSREGAYSSQPDSPMSSESLSNRSTTGKFMIPSFQVFVGVGYLATDSS